VNLPPEFIRTIKNSFGADGETWLSTFPDLIADASIRWGLTDVQPLPNLSYNFVAFVRSNAESNISRRWLQSQPVPAVGPGEILQSTYVLKLGVPNRELTSEIAALRFYNGRGVCRLLDADAEKGVLLLERLQPGRMLSTIEDDGHATRIAAEVMKKLWKSSNDFSRFIATEVATTDFIYLKDWFDGFNRLRQRYDGKTGPLPKSLVETAELLAKELLTENKDEALLHGDFHHFNVLESERGWLAIDPKGVIGPKGYEVGPFLINPVPDFLNGSNPKKQAEKRIAILSEMLGMERERIRNWGICHAVLSAWWNLEDKEDWTYAIRCAKLFTTF